MIQANYTFWDSKLLSNVGNRKCLTANSLSAEAITKLKQ